MTNQDIGCIGSSSSTHCDDGSAPSNAAILTNSAIIHEDLPEYNCLSDSLLCEINNNELSPEGLKIHNTANTQLINIVGLLDKKYTTITGLIAADFPSILVISDSDGVILKNAKFQNILGLKLISWKEGKESCNAYSYIQHCLVQIHGLLGEINNLEIKSATVEIIKSKTLLTDEVLKLDYLTMTTSKETIIKNTINATNIDLTVSRLIFTESVLAENIKIYATDKIFFSKSLESQTLDMKSTSEVSLHNLLIHGDLIIEAKKLLFEEAQVILDGVKGKKCYIASPIIELGDSNWQIGNIDNLYETSIRSHSMTKKDGTIKWYGNAEIMSTSKITLPDEIYISGTLTIIPGFINQHLTIDGNLKVIGAEVSTAFEIQIPQKNDIWAQCQEMSKTWMTLPDKSVYFSKCAMVKSCTSDNSGFQLGKTGFDLARAQFTNKIYGQASSNINESTDNSLFLKANNFIYIGSSFFNRGVIEIADKFVVEICGRFHNQGKIFVGDIASIVTLDKVENEVSSTASGSHVIVGETAIISAKKLYISGYEIHNLGNGKFMTTDGSLELHSQMDITNAPSGWSFTVASANVRNHAYTEAQALYSTQLHDHVIDISRKMHKNPHSIHRHTHLLPSAPNLYTQKIGLKNNDGKVIESALDNPAIHVINGDYIRTSKQGTISDKGVLVRIDNGNMIVEAGHNIDERLDLNLKNHGAVYYINGGIYYEAQQNIVQIGTTKFVTGNIEGKATGNIIQETSQTVIKIQEEYGKNYKNLVYKIDQHRNAEYVHGNIKYEAGNNFEGKGSLIAALGDISISAKNKVEIETITKYATNEYYKLKKRWYGSSSVAIKQSVSDTAIATLDAGGTTTISSAGECIFEGVEIPLNGQLEISCKKFAKLNHAVTNKQSIETKSSGFLPPSLPALDLISGKITGEQFVDNLPLVGSLKRMFEMEGMMDLWPALQFAAEIPAFQRDYDNMVKKLGTDKDPASPVTSFIATMLKRYASATIHFGTRHTYDYVEETRIIHPNFGGENVVIKADEVLVEGEIIGSNSLNIETNDLTLKGSKESKLSISQIESSTFDFGISLDGITLGYSESEQEGKYTKVTNKIGRLTGAAIKLKVNNKLEIENAQINGKDVTIEAAQLQIKQDLDIEEQTLTASSMSTGISIDWSGNILPFASFSLTDNVERSGLNRFISGISGENVKVTAKKLIYNVAQVTGSKSLELKAEQIEEIALPQEYEEVQKTTIAGGVSMDKDGKVRGNIGGSYENEHGKISGMYSPDMMDGMEQIGDAAKKIFTAEPKAEPKLEPTEPKTKPTEAKEQATPTEQPTEAEPEDKPKQKKNTKSDTRDNRVWKEITIQDGDTLSDLAVKYDTTVEELKAQNSIDNPDEIIAGKPLKVPDKGSANNNAQPAPQHPHGNQPTTGQEQTARHLPDTHSLKGQDAEIYHKLKTQIDNSNLSENEKQQALVQIHLQLSSLRKASPEARKETIEKLQGKPKDNGIAETAAKIVTGIFGAQEAEAAVPVVIALPFVAALFASTWIAVRNTGYYFTDTDKDFGDEGFAADKDAGKPKVHSTPAHKNKGSLEEFPAEQSTKTQDKGFEQPEFDTTLPGFSIHKDGGISILYKDDHGVEHYEYWDKQTEFKGNKVYQRDDLIEPGRINPENGKTSLELMKSGKAPIGPDGKRINIHHLIQTNEGGLAEITAAMHQKYYSTLHIDSNKVPSKIDRAAHDKWRGEYWKSRAKDFENN